MKTKLTQFEQTILDLLLKNQGKVVTRKEISDKLLGKDEPALSNLVDVHIKNLRRKLPDAMVIDMVRGKGYRIN